jgi:hypothetical protein
MGAPEMQRVRGTVESADGNSVTIKTIEGKSETVSLADEAKFALVVKSSLDAIKDGVFIGTATKGDDPPTALEVVIFPEAMRGAAEGHYDWDMIPDTVAGGTRVKSAMTNGTVKASSSTAPKVNTSMTNATVAKSTSSGEDKILTVTYDKDQSKTIASCLGDLARSKAAVPVPARPDRVDDLCAGPCKRDCAGHSSDQISSMRHQVGRADRQSHR